MSPDSPLARLAQARGIEAGYHDIWGNWHALQDETARRHLGAMGIDASSDEAIEAALSGLGAERWLHLLQPVCVSREDEPLSIPVALSVEEEGAPVLWCLREEGGDEHEGTLIAHEHELLEEAELDGQKFRRRRITLPRAFGPGYHDITVSAGSRSRTARLIIAPARCQSPPDSAAGRRSWGIALQLYGLRSQRNWGIGDLGDLACAATVFGKLGADLIGINPLHALYPDEPERASPYSPSSRRFANALYLDVEAIADFAQCDSARALVETPAFQEELERLRASELVDYAGVAALKWPVLRELYGHFRARVMPASRERAQSFRRYQETGGQALRLHAVFEVLHARSSGGAWPDEFLDPHSPAVSDFARAHIVEVEFYEYLQWLLSEQIGHVQECARAGGMRIGLYRDLAVGSDAFGADVWRSPESHARDVSIGAPPDDFNLQGQVWGLPPWMPGHLAESGYEEYVAALRANMQDSGALRIDHVIGLLRLFWVPAGETTAEGAFVRYPLHELLSILALESVRTGCVVIGEDLGTVPDELRAALYDYGVLSYRVLYFSKNWHSDHSFQAPDSFPDQALVTVTTHDLPTFAGFWCGRDLDVRDTLGLFPNEEMRERLRVEREYDRARLLDALGKEGLRPAEPEQQGSGLPSPALVAAVHRYVARSRCALMMVQIEDVLGLVEQANVPGTVQEQPNWRRRVSLPLDEWSQYAPLRELAAAICEERAAGS
jgi:(1->4)-alpha-D-glucan 1-alpha-D-glucosylmutase